MPHRFRTTRCLAAAAAAVLAAAPAPAVAQGGAVDPQCAAALRPLQDACQKSVDLFDFMAPQLGTALAGGNAVIGEGGAYAQVGRFSLGLRATAFEGGLPQIQDVSLAANGARSANVAVSDQYLGAPAADAAIALFPGLRVGGVRVGAVDLLGTATYIPEFESDELSIVTPSGSLKLGYGARVGLVAETTVLPGLALTFLRRDLPRVDLFGTVATSGGAADDTLGVRALAVETRAWRVVAGKRLSVLGLSAGVGQDRYRSRARLGAVVNESVPGFPAARFEAPEIELAQRLTRTSYFADVSLNFPGIRLAGEIGRATGGRVRDSFNAFDGGDRRGDDDLLYFGAGIRVGF
jgi:hypothetical protein